MHPIGPFDTLPSVKDLLAMLDALDAPAAAAG